LQQQQPLLQATAISAVRSMVLFMACVSLRGKRFHRVHYGERRAAVRCWQCTRALAMIVHSTVADSV
jgi:hypothetical protein